jgi:CheY-like chemotaxis protein
MKQVCIILLVDDNPADVDLAREALRGNFHRVQVESVGDGEEAMSFLNRTGIHAEELRPDLVILDLNLPKKDGRVVLAEVKGDTDLHTIPIVVFSTSHLMLDIGRSYELGANCYVSKPGNLKDYLLAVQSIEQFWFGSASLPRKEK